MPMFWTAQELQLLQGTSLGDKLAGRWQMEGCHVEPPTQVTFLAAPAAAAAAAAID